MSTGTGVSVAAWGLLDGLFAVQVGECRAVVLTLPSSSGKEKSSSGGREMALKSVCEKDLRLGKATPAEEGFPLLDEGNE